MKKGIAALLAVFVLLGVMMVPVSVAEETVPAGEYGTDYVKYGDINFDKNVNATDALKALQFAVQKTTLNETEKIVANVNADQQINAVDALQMLQMAVGKLTEFKAGVYYVMSGEPTPTPTGNYIMDYNKSNSVNGAYVKDPTADTTFVLDTSSLDEYTLYRFGAATVKNSDGNNNADYARLIYSLQGLLNRDFGMDEDHTSVIYMLTDLSDTGWLNVISEPDSILRSAGTDLQGLTEKRISDWDGFYEEFKDVIKSCGIILWDGNVPATANVAATICGLDGYLPVLAESPLHKALVADGVEVKMSLVGMFKNGQKGQMITGTSINSTGSAKNDAYLWALEKYFNRCSSTYLAYIPDGAITVKGYDAYTDNAIATIGGEACLPSHDYLIARRCFFFDLAPYKGEAACDDPAQKNGQADIGTDNATMLKIFQARYDRANGAFGQLMGFPPWWIKYTTHNNQGSKVNTWVEWLYCEYITCYNLAKEADAAQPATMTNGSVYYKYVPSASQYENNRNQESITYSSDTYYYTIYVGDYDSSAWLKSHIYEMWIRRNGDKRRGEVALMWSINPNLSYRVPMIFDYMYENGSPLDYFVGGDGGAGYIIPEGLFHDKTLSYMGEKRPAGNAAAGQLWADYTKPFYERLDMDITGFLINGANGGVSKNIAHSVAQYAPVGNFINASSAGVVKYNNTYFVNCYTGIAKTNASSTMYSFASKAMNAGCNFGAYRTICHTPTEIKGNVDEFQTYAESKGMKVKYCDPYTYFKLLKQSGQGTVIQ